MQDYRYVPLSIRACGEQGVALIVSLMAMTLMMALGLALVLTTMTEGRIASNYRDGTEALYAADAAVERVMQDILTVADWDTMLADVNATSAFIDGDGPGDKVLADGTTINLTALTNVINCGKSAPCADADYNALTDERPWGANNPRWKLYAYGPISDMLPIATIDSSMYVVVWVADDPSENDCDPLKDGGPPGCGALGDNLGRGVIAMMAYAYGPNGVHRRVEVTLAKTDTTEIERGYTGQRGQDEQNRRARKAAVQTPGKALTRTTLSTGA
jgi:hypothetical protein